MLYEQSARTYVEIPGACKSCCTGKSLIDEQHVVFVILSLEKSINLIVMELTPWREV